MSGPTRNSRRLTRVDPIANNDRNTANRDNCFALDQDMPENWTVAKLREELKRIGVSVAPRSKHALLVKQYKQSLNIDRIASDPDTASSDSGRSLPVQAPLSPDVSPSEFKAMQETISGLLTSVRTLTDIVTAQNGSPVNIQQQNGDTDPDFTLYSRPSQTVDSTGATATQSTANRGQYTQTQFGFSAESLPFVETILPSVRKHIQNGKDVNLTTLLMPYYNGPQSDKSSNEKQDPRLQQSLTLPQFIQAFGIYKNVMCQAHPHRREELDMYERDIIDMASRYNGKGFYEYHKMFSAQAAAQQH